MTKGRDRRFAVLAVSRPIGHRRTDGTESINWLCRSAADQSEKPQ